MRLAFLCLLCIACFGEFLEATLLVGTGEEVITPPTGTPSAGYVKRQEGMVGVHDPLLATAVVIDTGTKVIALCGVDSLGFSQQMVQEIQTRVNTYPELEFCEVYVGSSHTHAGGGAFLDIPIVGAALAGKYDPNMVELYVNGTVQAIVRASRNKQTAKLGVGYGEGPRIQKCRTPWPPELVPNNTVTVIKITTVDNHPLAAVFNYAIHPTVLPASNKQFSADLIGYARQSLRKRLGDTLQPIYFNGAQAEIIPRCDKGDFAVCEDLGVQLAETVEAVWNKIIPSDTIQLATIKQSYSFKPKATPEGLVLPIDSYETEVNLLVFDKVHAFVTIPGELSICYDRAIQAMGADRGYQHVSIFGLTNDAHGYIITPDAWRYPTRESSLSFGGECYGNTVQDRIIHLLNLYKPCGDENANSGL